METPVDIMTAIRDLGLPAAILLLVLLRLEPKVDKVTAALEALTDAVQLHVVSQGHLIRPDRPKGKQP